MEERTFKKYIFNIEVTKLEDNVTLYKYELTKAIHNMHMAHYRKLKKEARRVNVDNEVEDSA